MNQPEVRDFGPTVRAHEDVGWLHITMDEPGLVRGGESTGGHLDLPCDLLERSRLGPDPGIQRTSLRQFHRDEGTLADGPDLIHRHEFGVLEGGHRLRLLPQSNQRIGIGAPLEQLERQRPAEVGVDRQIHFTERPFPEQPLDIKASQPLGLILVSGHGLHQLRHPATVREVEPRLGKSEGGHRLIERLRGRGRISARHRRTETIANIPHFRGPTLGGRGQGRRRSRSRRRTGRRCRSR